MRTYYDILQRNSYQVLYFDFSKAGCSLPGADLMSSFNEYCSIIINQFAHTYASFYDDDYKEIHSKFQKRQG